MSKRCRLIFDEPAPGVWNMAVDEALLESTATGGPPTLRFYGWSEPTLSLGYFQSYRNRESHEPSRRLPVVRRSTGGGAIVHDRELTYSLALPPEDSKGRDAVALTCLVHRALIEALEETVSGLAQLSTCGQEIPGPKEDKPFLCFQRRSPGDVIARDGDGLAHKLCGSAQRRRRETVLQHGGLLLARSQAAPELPGVEELRKSPVEVSETIPHWSRKILSALNLEARSGELTPDEARSAQRIARERFANPTWTERR